MSTIRDSIPATKRKRRDRTVEKTRKRKKADDLEREGKPLTERQVDPEHVRQAAHSSGSGVTEHNGAVQYYTPDSRSNQRVQSARGAVSSGEGRAPDEPEPRDNSSATSPLPVVLHDKEWDISRPAGGQLLPRRVHLTTDEKYFILAIGTSVYLHSVANSALVDQLTLPDEQRVSSYDLSVKSPDTLYIAASCGTVTRWKLRQYNSQGETSYWFDSRTKIRDLKIVLTQDNKDAAIVLEDQGSSRLVLHRPNEIDEAYPEGSRILLQSHAYINSFETDTSARILVASTSDYILVGNPSKQLTDGLQGIDYIWRKFRCKDSPVSLALRVQEVLKPSSLGSKKDAHSQGRIRESVDLAVGGLHGKIYFYADLLEKLEHLEMENPQPIANNNAIVPRVVAKELHWHQNAVQALTWSRDGNYLISGGSETVLVLWQLSTGQKQFLPRLESPVCDITVSKSGARYAIRLGDNSAMILSTSELSPEANVSGVQSKVLVPYETQRPSKELQHISKEQYQQDEDIWVPCTSHPTAADRMLLVVGGAQGAPTSQSFAAPLLQTIEIHSRGPKGMLTKHISRQALTRTNATNIGIGPDGRPLPPPNVKHLSITYNGRWLVTAEEWCAIESQPSQSGSKGLYAKAPKLWRECILKFWFFDQTSQTWKLHQQISRPHPSDDYPVSSSILALLSFKTHQKFASLGDDSTLCIWKLRSNTNEPGDPDIRTAQWVLDRAISLEKALDYEPTRDTRPLRGCFAISRDDTMLAVSQNFPQGNEQLNGTVHIIDVDDGSIRISQQGLFTSTDDLKKLAFLNQNLICLGFNHVMVWDLTSFELLLSYDLIDGSIADNYRHLACAIPQIAVHEQTSAFAVAVPYPSLKTGSKKTHKCECSKSILGVFTIPSRGIPSMFVTKLEHLTMGLMSVSNASTDSRLGTFAVLDSAAQIRHVRQTNFNDQHSETESELQQTRMNGVDVEYQRHETPGSEAIADEYSVEEIKSMVVGSGSEHARVVRPEDFTVLLDRPSHTVPPLPDTYQSIVELYAVR